LILVAYAKAAGFFQGVALGGGLGVGIGARLGNVVFWIVIGAVAGLAIAAPEDDAPTRDHP
jgi:hypothetical protein